MLLTNLLLLDEIVADASCFLVENEWPAVSALKEVWCELVSRLLKMAFFFASDLQLVNLVSSPIVGHGRRTMSSMFFMSL